MKKVKSIRATGLAALVASIALAPLAEARLEKLLPAETYFAAQLPDVVGLQKKYAAHPYNASLQKLLVEDGYFGPAIKKIKEEMAKDKDFDLAKVEELLNFVKTNASGEVLFSVIKTVKPVKGHQPFDFVLAADVAIGDKEVVAFIEKLTESIKKSKNKPPKPVTSQYQGVTLYEYQETNKDNETSTMGGWAIANKTLVFTTAPNVLRDLVDAALADRKNNFGDTAIWKRGRITVGETDFFTVVNLPEISSTVRAYIASETAKEEGEDAPPINFVHIYDTFLPDVFGTCWFSMKLTPDGAYSKGALAYKEKRGILSLLTYKPLETVVPSFAPEKTMAFGSYAIDGSLAIKNLEALFQSAMPAYKMLFDGQIQEFKTKEGVDLRGAIFENLGDTFSHHTDIKVKPRKKSADGEYKRNKAPFEINGVYAIGIRDTAKLESLIKTVLGKAGKGADESVVKTHEFMGVKINKIIVPGEEQHFAYAFFDGKLFFGMGERALENAISEHKDPKASAAKNPQVQEILRGLPKDIIGFEYADAGAIATTYIDFLEAYIGSESGKDAKEFINPAKRPTAADFPWTSHGYYYERDNEIVFEAFATPKK